MTNEQILRKAIEKALKGGWQPISDMGQVHDFEVYRGDCAWIAMWVSFNTKIGDGGQLDIVRIFFSHDFAKAFWGEGDTGGDSCKSCGYNGCYKVWKYHLSKMVLEKEPLKYLEGFI